METEAPDRPVGGKKPGPHTEKRLSASFVRNAPPGRHTDGGGLYLQVDASGARRWLLRLTVRRKRCDFGLGSAKVLSLAEARERAVEMRKVVLRGGNPKVRQREEDGKHLTFEDLARRVHHRKFKENKSNGKHIAQWITTLETYAFPVLGKMSVEDVSQIEIDEVLDPIWTAKPETARRVLQRISTVFDHACGMGYRTKGNPAIGLRRLLRKQEVETNHFVSIDYHEASRLFVKLKPSDLTGALALQLTMLTACRSGPVRLATWDEFDENLTTWSIPKEKMKTKIDFSIPLSLSASSLLERVRKNRHPKTSLVFPSPSKPTQPISENTMRQLLQTHIPDATVHGMRATFRTWAREVARCPDDVAEVALAHSVGSKTVVAYKRTDLFDERHILMEKWAMWLDGEWEWFDSHISPVEIEREIKKRWFGPAAFVNDADDE
jgi:integrase